MRSCVAGKMKCRKLQLKCRIAPQGTINLSSTSENVNSARSNCSLSDQCSPAGQLRLRQKNSISISGMLLLMIRMDVKSVFRLKKRLIKVKDLISLLNPNKVPLLHKFSV